MAGITLHTPNVVYSDDTILSQYTYQSTRVERSHATNGKPAYSVIPFDIKMQIKTERIKPRTGVMLVGWGGNNGSTLTASILANKHNICWNARDGLKTPNYYGSLVLSSTMSLGICVEADGVKKICRPISELLPFVDPNDLEIDGWDINDLDLGQCLSRSSVLDYDLQQKLRPYMSKMKPRKSVFNLDYVAQNQLDRANNVITGTLSHQLEQIRSDIKDFKTKKHLDKVIVMWTASTERYTELNSHHVSSSSLLDAIKNNLTDEVAPSVMFACASILEGCIFINGSPQNTLYPAVVELAELHGAFVAGDDFKTGQTKVKSALVEFLVGSGIKPMSIASYNHLGNNDGKNLDSYKQFRSKEISKSTVIDEMIESNKVLYPDDKKPDHCVVIKYIPYVNDSKRALDEYVSEICMHGNNTLVIHNTCEDSLLACTVMLDLILLSEMLTRISIKMDSAPDSKFKRFHNVLSALSFFLKAPVTTSNEPLINGFFSQKCCIENLVRACLSLPPENHLYLECKLKDNTFSLQ